VVWLILSAGFVVGVALLGIVGLAVLSHLRPLQLAARRLEAKQGEVSALQAKVEAMQKQVEGVQERVALLAAREKNLK
jgi:hypothetical protein